MRLPALITKIFVWATTRLHVDRVHWIECSDKNRIHASYSQLKGYMVKTKSVSRPDSTTLLGGCVHYTIHEFVGHALIRKCVRYDDSKLVPMLVEVLVTGDGISERHIKICEE